MSHSESQSVPFIVCWLNLCEQNLGDFFQNILAVYVPRTKKVHRHFIQHRYKQCEHSTHLKLLGEGVGAVQLHDMLRKLLDCQWLVTVCNDSVNI